MGSAEALLQVVDVTVSTQQMHISQTESSSLPITIPTPKWSRGSTRLYVNQTLLSAAGGFFVGGVGREVLIH
jgi:hypothetical protein